MGVAANQSGRAMECDRESGQNPGFECSVLSI